MSRPSKGARLVWRNAYFKKDGSLMSAAGWFVEDGGKRYRIGCGKGQLVEAQIQLANHIAERHVPARARDREPDQKKIADVVNVYADDVAKRHAAPKATATRLLTILEFFGSKRLSDINGKLCRDYAAQAPSLPTARRQLEDLRAAINHYHDEGYVTTVPKIVMPPKSVGRQRWLTRSEAARLLWAAWRMKQSWRGQDSDRSTGKHVARFILVAVYTGTRSGAICAAAIRPTEGRGYVDLDRGVFFRRAAGERETKKRQPPVRLPDRLLAHIRRWSNTPVEVKTKARGKSKTTGQMIAHDYVVEWQGKSVQSIRKAFRSPVKIAGLGEFDVAGNFSTDITPHILRHTAATWLMQNGTHLSLAADYLGMSEAVLRDVYYHHHPDFQAEAAERITAKAPAFRAKTNVVRLR
jgi:integrase